MSDHHHEEQEMEAEALAAIFDNSFQIKSSSPLHHWSLMLQPHLDDDEEDNHVSVELLLTLPETYPDEVPEIDVRVIKGLAESQRKVLIDLATEEAQKNVGMPVVYAIGEVVKEWLGENNIKGLEDESMHAQMMRRAREEERLQAKSKQRYESQTETEQLTQAEIEDIEVRKRRAEGTPCTKENFEKWKIVFDEEMAQELEKRKEEGENDDFRKKKKSGGVKKKSTDARNKKEEEAQQNRMTGLEFFSQKTGGSFNLDALERAADEAAAAVVGGENDDYDGKEVNEDLFDEDLFEDEEDLDDMDFDTDEEEIDI